LSTTSPTPRVRVPRYVARLVTRLVVDYFTYIARPVASAHCAACRVTHRRLLRLVQARRQLLRLHRASGVSRHVVWLVTRLVVDYFDYAARPGASARRAARRRLLRLRHASGCLGTSHGSSSTTSPTPRVQVPRHVVRIVAPLVVDNFTYTVRPGASVCCVARLTARRRLLRLCRASGCLVTSRSSSRGSSSTTPCTATLSCGHICSTSATPCIATTCLAATLALLRVRHAPPRRRLPVASRRPFISTSFPN
jgi:hypothetical protein